MVFHLNLISCILASQLFMNYCKINNLENSLLSIQNNGEQETVQEIPADELRKIEEELKKSGYI